MTRRLISLRFSPRPRLAPRGARARRSARSTRPARRRGLTLLETILAIAILGGAIAAVGESIRLGSQAASDARDYAMGQLLCEAKLTELASGLQPLMPVVRTPMEVAPDWLYTVEIQPVDQQTLLAIFVTVERDPVFSARPLTVTLTRWLLDPDMLLQLRSTDIETELMRQSSGSGSAGGGF
jgi:prepilin-type N-terminal cleavage/methylation domain-containing protein